MDEIESNPRAVIGDNRPPLPRLIIEEENLAAQVTEFLTEEHRGLVEEVTALLDKARDLPKEITDDEQMAVFAALIKQFREITKRIEALHAGLKAPYWTAGQAVDAFFFQQWERCSKRTKTSRNGGADVLQARLDDYLEQKRIAEEEDRRQKAEAAAKAAREAAAKAEADRRAAEEARLAAERARKEEAIAAKGAVAEVREAVAAESRGAAELAFAKAEEAHIATLAKPADMVRQRLDDGITVTQKVEPYSLIEDESKLDKEKLWPFIKLEAKQQALNAWAKTTGHNQQMAGAKIGRKAKGQVL